MKIALVYDRVNKWGGAERVLLALHDVFPEAVLFTSVCDIKKAPWVNIFSEIHTSFLQYVPFAKSNHELLAILMPMAFEQFNFDKYDLVISVTSEAAKGIITKPRTVHLSFCLTPTRYLWSGYNLYFKNPILKFFATPAVSYLRAWDRIAAQRPDKIIAISLEVKNRIKKYYGRDSEIIFPPLGLGRSRPPRVRPNGGGYYLIVSRLVSYKKVALAIKAFNQLKYPLYIVGRGFQEKKLKRMAGVNIKFFGEVSERALVKLYSGAKALVMPQEEDFGLVAVEAQSLGVPVIAFAKGGAAETVIDGKTGVLFKRQTVASLKAAIAKFVKMSFNHKYLQKNAERFSKGRFERQLQRSLIRLNTGRGWGDQALAKVKE